MQSDLLFCPQIALDGLLGVPLRVGKRAIKQSSDVNVMKQGKLRGSRGAIASYD